MTISIQQLYQQAQLAEASYSLFDLLPDYSNTSLILSLTDDEIFNGSFSESQAQQFVTQWRLVHHIPDTNSGFSATLFERLDASGNGTGEFSLAIRGSTSPADFGADGFDIFLDGVVLDQMIDLYNYWRCLSTPQNSTYQAAQLVTLADETLALRAAYALNLAAGLLYEESLRTRTDVLIDKPTLTVKTVQFIDSSALTDSSLQQGLAVFETQPSSLSVTGHSLGGHLAMAFTRLFPGIDTSAFGINGLGFRPANSNVTNLFGMLSGPGGFDSAKIFDAYGLSGPEFASQNTFLLSQPGGYQGIFIEDGGFATWGGHIKTQMTDSLAVYDLFAKVDPALNTPDPKVGIDRITGILEAMSNAPELTLEAALDSLRTLFKEATVQFVVPTPKDQRETFYQNLNDVYFQNRISGYTGLLSIESLVGKDVSTIEANAFGGTGYRYALKTLNPFVVLGEDGIYDQYNQSSELDVYDPVTGAGTLTSQWISDRAGFVARKIEVNTADRLYAIDAGFVGSVWYQDKALQENAYAFSTLLSPIAVISLGIAVQNVLDVFDARRVFFGADNAGDQLHGDADTDFLYGGGGNDALNGLGQADFLQGDAGDDRLYGGAGNDTLVGGKDADQLDGGLGDDIYVWNKGDGFDTIIDARENGGTGVKLGTIQFLSQSLAGTKTQVDPANPGLFTDGQGVFYAFYGVSFGEGTLVIVKQGEEGGLTIRGFRSGDFGIDLGPVAPIQKTDKFGTASADDGSDPESPLYNDAPNQKIFALDGDDGILITTAGTEGYGGEGQDFIYAPDLSGGHKLYGEGGRDILIAWGSELYGGLDDDALTAGVGEDYLEGNEGSDVLAGNLGQDVLVGGDGNDYLLGGSSYSAGNFGWSVSVDANNVAVFDQFNGEFSVAGDGGDLIKGESGADSLWGGEGNDALYGGTENDYLQGDAGSDELFGEDGNDKLWGDSNLLPPEQHGADYLDGGVGEDELVGSGGADILFGGLGNDILYGDADTMPVAYQADDYLDGEDGDDQLYGNGGADTIFGGEGNDIAFGDAGDDYLDGGAGADQLSGSEGNDAIFGGAGVDLMHGDDGDDYLDGGEEGDQIAGDGGNDVIFAGAGADRPAAGVRRAA